MKPVGDGEYRRTRMWFTILICVGAFLLVIGGFFLFTISASQPIAMKLYLPRDSERVVENKIPNGPGSLTLILDKNDIIYYYEGELAKDGSNVKTSNFKEIRNVIVSKKKSTDEKDFIVIIKPAEKATYTNTVDILDEMTLNEVKKYSMVDVSPSELDIIKKKNE